MQWITGILGAILLGLMGGLGWAAVGFVIGVLGWLWLRRSGKKRRGRQIKIRRKGASSQRKSGPPPLPQPSSMNPVKHFSSLNAKEFPPPQPSKQGGIQITITSDGSSIGRGSGKGVPCTWHTPEQPVSFEGLKLSCGLFYSSNGDVAWPGEPSAINTKLKVGKMAESPVLDLGYYPSYENFTSGQRRTYLEWLAAGRRDSDPSLRSLGYLFLAFYGFERRLLIEGDTDPRIASEIAQLLEIYGGVHTSRSLRGYFLQLLQFSGWKQGAQSYRALWPDLLQLDGDRPDEDGMRLVLANLHDLGEPMDWTVGYRVAMTDENSRRSTVVSRTREKFWELFRQRFEESHPEGITLQAAKLHSVIKYRPASQSLLQLAYQGNAASAFELRVSNVLGLRRQFKNLPDIWNSCVDDLSGYSRAVASKKQGMSASVAAWSALPPALREREVHPLAESLQGILVTAPQESGYSLVPAGVVASLLEIPERERLTLGQSLKISSLLNELGYLMAPMPEFTSIPLSWSQEIAVFPRAVGQEPGAHIPGIVRFLHLAITLAAADGVIEDDEINAFNKHIGQEVLNDHDWSHLRATEAVLRRDANLALRALPQIASQIAAQSKPAVFRTLVHIASTDGEIGLDEMKMLRRISRAFELEDDALDHLLREDPVFGEVAVTGREEASRDKGEPIPQRAEPGRATGTTFKLDMDRIRALKQETHEVISLLSVVMDDNEDVVSTAVPSGEVIKTDQVSVPLDWLNGLDDRYHAAMANLVRHDQITLEDFEKLAVQNHLISDDLLNAVNAWSDETLGDFLLDRASNVRIFTDLLPPEARISGGTLRAA